MVARYNQLTRTSLIGYQCNDIQCRDALAARRTQRASGRSQETKAKGAELMMVTEISICPVEFSAKELSEAAKMPVIEGMGCAVAVAELFHRLGVPPQPGTAAVVVELARGLSVLRSPIPVPLGCDGLLSVQEVTRYQGVAQEPDLGKIATT